MTNFSAVYKNRVWSVTIDGLMHVTGKGKTMQEAAQRAKWLYNARCNLVGFTRALL